MLLECGRKFAYSISRKPTLVQGGWGILNPCLNRYNTVSSREHFVLPEIIIINIIMIWVTSGLTYKWFQIRAFVSLFIFIFMWLISRKLRNMGSKHNWSEFTTNSSLVWFMHSSWGEIVVWPLYTDYSSSHHAVMTFYSFHEGVNLFLQSNWTEISFTLLVLLLLLLLATSSTHRV